jgi:1-acyl-sn-glycerol-3-phosphate acyltransferase
MDRYPYAKPPRWWSPFPSRFWIRVWRPWRRYQQIHEQRIVDVDAFGLERVRAAIDRGHGILVTPNHVSHGDCYVLFHALEQLPRVAQVMTAWQVFALLPWLQRTIYRQYGCFSVDREANDLTAFRHAVRVLEHTSDPLVIFPEGEVYHLNDRVTPFRDGTTTIALSAVRRAGRPVECFPCAMKYYYVRDPTPQLVEVMDRLERRVGRAPRGEMPLAERIERFTHEAIALRETQYLGAERTGPLQPRIDGLADEILRRLEQRYSLPGGDFVPERVKQIRQLIIDRTAALPAGDPARDPYAQDMEHAFAAVQLYSYRADYVAQRPTVERMAETIDKYEEDFLGLRTANVRGARRATITFGEPIVLERGSDRANRRANRRDEARELGAQLRDRVQALLDGATSEPNPTRVRPSRARVNA